MGKDFGGKLFAWSLLAVPFLGVFSQAKMMIFSVPLYVPEILIILALLGFFLIQNGSIWVFSPRVDIFFSAFVLIALGLFLSAFANDMTIHGYGRMKSWFLFPLLYGGMFSYALRKGLISLRDILRSVFLGGILMGFSVLLSILSGGGFSYDHRLHGFLPSPNHLAMFLGATIVMSVWLVHSLPVNQRKEQRFASIGILFLALLLLLTQSYAVIFSVISVLCIGILSYRHSFSRKQLVIIFLGCALCSGVLFTLNHEKWQSITSFDERSSLASRIMIWHSAVRMIADHPLLGIGPGNFQAEYLRYQQYFPPYLEWSAPHPHNVFLDLWLEGGLLGVTGLALLFWQWLSSATKLFFQKERENAYCTLPLFFGLYFVLTGLSDVPFLRNDLAYLFASGFAVSVFLLRGVSDRSSHHDD